MVTCGGKKRRSETVNDCQNSNMTFASPAQYFANRPSRGPVTITAPKPLTDADLADHSKQTISIAEAALENYNAKNHTDYKLVDPVNSGGHIWKGKIWYHCNFTAKPETSSHLFRDNPGYLSTKLFFAELKIADPSLDSNKKYLVTACRPISDDRTKTTSQCEMCVRGIMHPTRGTFEGRYQIKEYNLRSRCNGKALSVIN